MHKTFLLFYQAVCYENLGCIAHEYSSNKIPLFEQARDAFILASEALPLPFLSESVDLCNENRESPVCPTFDILTFYNNSPTTTNRTMPNTSIMKRKRTFSANTSGLEWFTDHITCDSKTPSSKEYPPHPLCNTSSVYTTIEEDRISARDGSHMARLSRSLSSQHTLADYLVPSPLFSRGLSTGENSQDQVGGKPLILMTLSKPLPPTPINRPLPALPFNHKPEFVLKGKRLLLIPRRKTALATLISKFEGVSPFDSSLADKENLQAITPRSTISTQRFRRISAIFSEKTIATEQVNGNLSKCEVKSLTESEHRKSLQSNNFESPDTDLLEVHENEVQIPATPCPISRITNHQSFEVSALCSSSHRSPATPPSSPDSHLMLYNDALSSFRTSIQNHIMSITAKINSARATQLAHEEEKRRRFAGMGYQQASLAASPTKAANHRTSRISPSKDARLRSFWSLQNAEQREKADKNRPNDRMAQQKKERIARLKAGGWKDVSKEAKGWKGSVHYEKLRSMAQKELVAY